MQYHNLFTKLLVFSFLLVNSKLIVAASSPENKKTLTICKIIDDKDGSFGFIYENNSNKTLAIHPFMLSGNNLYLYFRNKKERWCLGAHARMRGTCHAKPMRKAIWFYNAKYRDDFPKWPSRFAALYWTFYEGKGDLVKHIYLWKPGKGDIDFTNAFDRKNAVNFKLAKILDGKPLTFALIISNDCEKEISVPDFLSPGNKVTIKFPDGKTVSHFFKKNDGKFFKLLPRQSIYLKFDISEFLKKSKNFSMQNFNYGISEFQWLVTMPDKSETVSKIGLLKAEKPLSKKAGYDGIWMDITTPIK